MSRFCSIEPVGILNACTTKVRMNSARMTAMTSDSKYSRKIDFLKPSVIGGEAPSLAFRPHFQHGEEGFLRNLDFAHTLHPLLALLLFLEQFPLARDIAPVALGQNVLAHCFHRLAGDDPAADGRLDGHFEHLTGNELPHLRGQRPAALVRIVAV